MIKPDRKDHEEDNKQHGPGEFDRDSYDKALPVYAVPRVRPCARLAEKLPSALARAEAVQHSFARVHGAALAACRFYQRQDFLRRRPQQRGGC